MATPRARHVVLAQVTADDQGRVAASKAPVLISHTGCRALADLPRNTRDEALRALAERGGIEEPG